MEKSVYAVTVLMNLLSWRIIKPFKTMATQPKKMNIIKQVLTGHKNGLSVRKMAEMYSMRFIRHFYRESILYLHVAFRVSLFFNEVYSLGK